MSIQSKTTVERLYDAAAIGDEKALDELLQEDFLVFERILSGCETPLHVSAILGHTSFVREILKRKPELAKLIDSSGSLPLHLAAARGHTQVAKFLIFAHAEGCDHMDIDGRNPIHLAAMNGHTDLIREILQVRPVSAKVLTKSEGTILQLCTKFNQYESFKLLVENDPDFVSVKDDDHNTVLHSAVSQKNAQIVKFLIDTTAIEVNAINIYGFTALDLSVLGRDQKDWMLEKLLLSSGAKHAKDVIGTTHTASTSATATVSQRNDAPIAASRSNLRRTFKLKWIEKKTAPLMIVATLIVTASIADYMYPPGGVWGETKNGHQAGRSVFLDNHPKEYLRFLVFDITACMSSCFIILLLISGLPVGRSYMVWVLIAISWISIGSLALSVVMASTVLMADSVQMHMVIYVWILVGGILFTLQLMRFAVVTVKLALDSSRST